MTSAFEASAYHEAGHAIIAWQKGNPILEPGITIDGCGAGNCPTQPRILQGEAFMWATLGGREIWNRFIVSAEAEMEEWLAGTIAERRFLKSGKLPLKTLQLNLKSLFINTPSDNQPDDLKNTVSDFLDFNPSDLRFSLRLMAEVRLAETGRADPALWNQRDERAALARFRVIESRLLRTFREPMIWKAVGELAWMLLHRWQVTPAECKSLLRKKGIPSGSVNPIHDKQR